MHPIKVMQLQMHLQKPELSGSFTVQSETHVTHTLKAFLQHIVEDGAKADD